MAAVPVAAAAAAAALRGCRGPVARCQVRRLAMSCGCWVSPEWGLQVPHGLCLQSRVYLLGVRLHPASRKQVVRMVNLERHSSHRRSFGPTACVTTGGLSPPVVTTDMSAPRGS